MEVVHDLVGYKGMKIVQNTEWFSFSLDSVLLARFVQLRLRDKRILDLGCGNAPIPLILSTRTKAPIIGIEIQKDVFHLAVASVRVNHLENQIEIKNMNMNHLLNCYDNNTFDVITMNPPYFKYEETSPTNGDIHKTIARHEKEMTLEEMLPIIYQLLKNNGTFAMVHRTERLIEIIELLRKNHLEPKRLQFVYPKMGKNSNLFLIESSKNGKSGVKLLAPLYVHAKDGTYQEEILNLFQ